MTCKFTRHFVIIITWMILICKCIILTAPEYFILTHRFLIITNVYIVIYTNNCVLRQERRRPLTDSSLTTKSDLLHHMNTNDAVTSTDEKTTYKQSINTCKYFPHLFSFSFITRRAARRWCATIAHQERSDSYIARLS